MGADSDLTVPILVAAVILAIWILGAFMMGRPFRRKKTRLQIMLGALGVYLVAFVSLFWLVALANPK